jgi:Uma2 family endonuclease
MLLRVVRRTPSSLPPEGRPRYLGPTTPVLFAEEAEVPETQLHFELRILLYQLLCDHLGLEASIGSDQFIYYDAADPERCVSPDVFVQLQPASGKIRSWKTWERGAPDIAVEIVSKSDAPHVVWTEKLQRYHALGVQEVVRFDPEGAAGEATLRVWNRLQGVLLEREPEAAPRSSVLDVRWVVAAGDGHAMALRITDARNSDALVPTRMEARQAAEARVRELEAELRRRS